MIKTKEHPILFSAPMVRAILNDTKNQTRRRVKEQTATNPKWWEGIKTQCPFGQIGDRLWVRETWQYVDFAGEDNGYVYRATDPDWVTMEGWTWKPSIFMPRTACRIELEITDIRAERLNKISEQDAINEGVDAIESYKSLWQKINGRDSWYSNPFVWVIQFKKITKTI